MRKYFFLVVIAIVGISSQGLADDQGDEESYVGGRGVITLSGMTGMFLNPTSGISANKMGVTAQACLAALPVIANTEHHILFYYLLDFAPLDWLDFGFQGETAQQNSDTHLQGAGFHLRGRLLKDENWWPEISVGAGVMLGPQKHLHRRDPFLALSKKIGILDGKWLRAIRFHAGGRFFSTPMAPDGMVGYGGGEVELIEGVWFVGEVQTKDGDIDAFMPYGFGVQGRAKNGWGVTIAGVQTGGQGYTNFPGRPGASGITGGTKKPAIYVGVGVSFF